MHLRPWRIWAIQVTLLLLLLHNQPSRPTQHGNWFRSYVPLDTKQVILKTFRKPISSLGMEKQNLTQQKHTFTHEKKRITTQRNKARFSRFLRHPARKQTGPILVLALHKFVTYLFTHLDTYLLTATGPTRGFNMVTLSRMILTTE